MKENDNTFGFIILRHVNNPKTNEYWIYCYECIRKYYPENLILIIDDNSNCQYVTEYKLYKTTVINSEYPQRGELLPYHYYLKNKLFDKAVIIHDSVFVNEYIDFSIDDKYKIIWDFEHIWDQIEDETNMIQLFEDSELLSFYQNKSLWTGCFGAMTIITHDFLVSMNNKHDLSKLLNLVTTRFNRKSFERVFACLLQFNSNAEILLGDIHKYIGDRKDCKIDFDEKNNFNHLPILKVWSGR